MRIRNLIITVIGLILLLIPVACMHLSDGHHTGDHHSLPQQPSLQYSTHGSATTGTTESCTTLQNIGMEKEGTQTQPGGDKGG